MKLKKHREDVKDLRLMSDAHVQDIARRYLNLVLYLESMTINVSLKTLIERKKRVLKDSEK